ncbi:MAG: HNH endonuclease [Paludibacteraceae bacterium]|nr:HNH endonuclease [Paludibacteraceae bacterium]
MIIYKKTGKCIWCGKTEPEVSFKTAPHILPRKLGGCEIGLDVCDDCNHFFGTAEKNKPNIDLVFKEIFGSFRFFSDNLNEHSYEKYSSVYFNYLHSKQCIKIKSLFCSSIITRQFKRALYNVFFQKYHFVTGNANNPMFDMVRDFARYNIGSPLVFYSFNNLKLTPGQEEMNNPHLPITNEIIDDMMKYGVFAFFFMGEIFYLEIFPDVFQIKGMDFLQKQAQRFLVSVKGNERIFEFTDVMQLDFFMMRFRD